MKVTPWEDLSRPAIQERLRKGGGVQVERSMEETAFAFCKLHLSRLFSRIGQFCRGSGEESEYGKFLWHYGW